MRLKRDAEVIKGVRSGDPLFQPTRGSGDPPAVSRAKPRQKKDFISYLYFRWEQRFANFLA